MSVTQPDTFDAGYSAHHDEHCLNLQDLVSAGEHLANMVGPLVEASVERNGPQVDADIVEAYREFRRRQNVPYLDDEVM